MSLRKSAIEDRSTARHKRFLDLHTAGHDRIYRYFRRRTANAATSEDLCAEVFRIAWEKSVDKDDLNVMFLFGVARNVLRNHARSANRSDDLLLILANERYDTHSPLDSPVLEALHELNPEDQEVLRLTYWDGLASKEIAQFLSISSAAVRMRLHRARKSFEVALTVVQKEEGANA
ncbi:RNA polymerase sigma factor [Paenarthrobacter sp. NPDC090522]|uniref:RNA polymerase sigma factor n=1 Tax=Paenarthrobacter sp. NPDC090522 TaxID=3364383 RepID=UPI0037FD4913